MGLGIQGGGVEVARTMVAAGAIVTVTDLKSPADLSSSVAQLKDLPITFILGEHRQQDFASSDAIIRNPGVPENLPLLTAAREHAIPVLMETALFAKYTSATLMGITGTRGKSTTTHMVAHILKTAGKQVTMAGNLPGKAALPLLQTLKQDDLVVLELSSWQLQGFASEKISPSIAIITSIYPDHLNRYSSMEEYIRDKTYIFAFQRPQDHILLNKDNLETAALASQVHSQLTWFSHHDLPRDLVLSVPGQHNRENAAAARSACMLLHVPTEIIDQALHSFKGVPFRLQTVATVNAIRIINDTTSTTPTATLKAIVAIPSPKTLILGGESKQLPVDELAQEINLVQDKLVLLSGSGTEEIKPLLDQHLILSETPTIAHCNCNLA